MSVALIKVDGDEIRVRVVGIGGRNEADYARVELALALTRIGAEILPDTSNDQIIQRALKRQQQPMGNVS